jgi:hypothetical protein
MRKVHKLNRTLRLAACEGKNWIFRREPKCAMRWSRVTCRRCLARKKGK